MAAATSVPAITGRWSETRPNGQPVEPGTFCWITEIAGEHPIATYGRTQEEVMQKLTYTMGTAQAEAARGKAARTTGPVVVPAPRARMSADELARATSDLNYPGKSGPAMVKIIEDVTGVNLADQPRIAAANRAEAWAQRTPEYYEHPGNAQLMMAEALRMAGHDWASISDDILTAAFERLSARGMLFAAPAASSIPIPGSEEEPAFPGGSPVQREQPPQPLRVARPGTGVPSTRFRGGNFVPTPAVKFTEQQIRSMPLSKQKELNNPSHPDYKAWTEACERLQVAR